ncbi:uracil-DNA glycosylase [Rheinheimera soli]|uniref:uracil-DNA glycosylase n=1 Tax=Rheinheimera soli TaxID=443616 RepID=UPI001E5D32A6|nr:uracil-DNA glycosylase [Rheinheimera soli]
MNIDSFVTDISSVQLTNVFNPYADQCDQYDEVDAAVIRRNNLREFIRVSALLGIETMWMGRDLGYRGGRRTGLALTDERHLTSFCEVYPGSVIKKSTTGPSIKERTADEIWSLLPKLNLPPLLWNVFPFHPYEAGNQFSNRKFTAKELSVAEEINAILIKGLGIKRIIAIGNDAAVYASRFGISVEKVRHPSYGGVNEFRSGIKELYAIKMQ